MKRLVSLMVSLCCLSSFLFSQGVQEAPVASVVASTSWVAAFADLAGVDDVVALAPASLRHPPEYELVPSNIVTVKNASVFLAAGYEKMMQTIQESLASSSCAFLKVTTENSIDVVKAETAKIAALTGTTPRLDAYITAVESGKEMVASSEKSKKVFCHKMQLPLAKDLGLEVVGTFGPGAVSAEEMKACKASGAAFIIDNVHNPVASPLEEVTNLPLVIWRNFPESVERDALVTVVQENIQALKEVL